jgi:hypothetical protein
MSRDLPNLQPEHHSDDAALIGACRRLLALDVVVQMYDGHDNETFDRFHEEWWGLLTVIAPIRAATDAGRVAKLHAALVAMRHSEDGFAELADDLVKSALAEFAMAHPFAGSPLRPDEIAALRRMGANIFEKCFASSPERRGGVRYNL